MLRTITAAALGIGLAAALGAVAVVRRDRPLHAYGSTHPAHLAIFAASDSGVPILDTAGAVEAVARTSRAASFSQEGPDVMGLALRLDGDSGRDDDGGDLLFASTGTGLLGRYLLQAHRSIDSGPLTTLLPMRSPGGLVQLALRPEGPATWSLAWSRPSRSEWTPVGTLTIDMDVVLPDPGHFDPTGRAPAGLTPPAWVRAMRAPAYRTARTLVPLPTRVLPLSLRSPRP